MSFTEFFMKKRRLSSIFLFIFLAISVAENNCMLKREESLQSPEKITLSKEEIAKLAEGIAQLISSGRLVLKFTDEGIVYPEELSVVKSFSAAEKIMIAGSIALISIGLVGICSSIIADNKRIEKSIENDLLKLLKTKPELLRDLFLDAMKNKPFAEKVAFGVVNTKVHCYGVIAILKYLLQLGNAE